jgi:hypothetical protein
MATIKASNIPYSGFFSIKIRNYLLNAVLCIIIATVISAIPPLRGSPSGPIDSKKRRRLRNYEEWQKKKSDGIISQRITNMFSFSLFFWIIIVPFVWFIYKSVFSGNPIEYFYGICGVLFIIPYLMITGDIFVY